MGMITESFRLEKTFKIIESNLRLFPLILSLVPLLPKDFLRLTERVFFMGGF